MIQSKLKDIDTIYAYANGSIRELTQVMCNDKELWSSFKDFFMVFSYTGTIKAVEIPYTGLYLLEAYGAVGSGGVAKGGKTLYHSILQKGDIVYACVGGRPYNGGGMPGQTAVSSNYGGGATHWGYKNALLKDTPKGDLLCVAGGGGGTPMDRNGGYHTDGRGGAGGGLSGNSGINGAGGGGATQTAGGTGYGSAGSGVYGQGGSVTSIQSGYYYAPGGGGGLYGGGASTQSGGGGGGSGYIKTETTLYKGKIYTNTTLTGNSNNGRAVITRIA